MAGFSPALWWNVPRVHLIGDGRQCRLECHWHLWAEPICECWPRARWLAPDNEFVTLSFLNWTPLFSGHPLSDLDLTWVSLAFAGTARHLTPRIVTRIYCCLGSRHRLPSVDCDCNHHLHQAQAETEAPIQQENILVFVCPSSGVADCETSDVDVNVVSVSPYYTKITVVIGGRPAFLKVHQNLCDLDHIWKNSQMSDEWRLFGLSKLHMRQCPLVAQVSLICCSH